MGKDELIGQLRGLNIAEMTATDVGHFVDEIARVTGQDKPAQIGKKRLMIENFYSDFKHLVGVDTSAPQQHLHAGRGQQADGAPPQSPSASAIDPYALVTVEDIMAEIAIRVQRGPLAANDVSALSTAITKAAGHKPPGSLAQKRVFVEDFFNSKGGMASAGAKMGLARARAEAGAAAPPKQQQQQQPQPQMQVQQQPGGSGGQQPFFDAPGPTVHLGPAGPRPPPTRAELFELCHRSVQHGRGWVRADTEAKQLASAIFQMTSMPVGPDPAQYVADWYNWMRWQTGLPAEPRAFRTRPKPRPQLPTPAMPQEDPQQYYAQQLQAQMYAQQMQAQAQQALMQQQLYQQSLMQMMGNGGGGYAGMPPGASPQMQRPGSAGYGGGGYNGGGFEEQHMQAQLYAQHLQAQQQQQQQQYGSQSKGMLAGAPMGVGGIGFGGPYPGAGMGGPGGMAGMMSGLASKFSQIGSQLAYVRNPPGAAQRTLPFSPRDAQRMGGGANYGTGSASPRSRGQLPFGGAPQPGMAAY